MNTAPAERLGRFGAALEVGELASLVWSARRSSMTLAERAASTRPFSSTSFSIDIVFKAILVPPLQAVMLNPAREKRCMYIVSLQMESAKEMRFSIVGAHDCEHANCLLRNGRLAWIYKSRLHVRGLITERRIEGSR